MNEIRLLLHDILNALSIARGLNEGVQSALQGELVMTTEQCIEKLSRSIKAMDRVEDSLLKIRASVQDNDK
jgi:hypothetical protein